MRVESSPSVHKNDRRPFPTRTMTIAIVAAIPIAACSDDPDGPAANTVGQIMATTAPPTGDTSPPPEATSATVSPTTETGSFAGAEDVPVTFTMPIGWENLGWAVIKSDADPNLGVSFFDVANIYADPCQWVLVDPPVGPTVDDLTSALASSDVFEATAPTNVTIDGFRGKYIELTVPDYDEDECKQGRFGLWKEDGPGGSSDDGPNLWAQAPDQVTKAWILDVDGTRLVIGAGYHPNTSAQDRADIDEIVSSIEIG